jgi:hypothetical protein
MSLASGGSITVKLYRDTTAHLLATITLSAIGTSEVTSFAETSIDKNETLFFHVDGASGGGDQITFGVFFKGFHVAA